MPSSLSPAFVRINYHSAYGLHTQTIPTLDWAPTFAIGGKGNFGTWDTIGYDADAMIQELITAEADIMPAGVEFDNYIIYTQATPTADPQPRASGTLAIPGAVASPGWNKAVQVTISMRTSNFGIFKLVLLDAATGDDFAKETVTVPMSALQAIFDILIDTARGWSGQDNGRPETFISQTKDLNDRLRKTYRLS